MLNKVKKKILPMLDTLGEALTQYLQRPSQELLDGINVFIDAINAQTKEDGPSSEAASERLKESLENPELQEVERLFNDYCAVIEGLPVQYKAVFLPYYDNTWDSLASVYEAFAADPRFVTEIVIIPIMRNTPTGWAAVYADYLTPQGIPNTHFSQYSFEQDLPDFVFYNNPYDGVNVEQFQFHNVRPHVGCMVYVPYFLYQHVFRDSAGVAKEIEAYTQLPGHDNADLFVVQGKSFLKAFAHRSRNGKKMVALGNPKTDHIYKNMHDYPRYPEWDKATKGKTVFFLNTHYRSAISGSYRSPLIRLLKLVEQNDDLALIWRPHPQSAFMLGDENSEKALEWQGYIDRVRSHERMILDQTASDISAIMYSDAVISHISSIVSESIFADKPVFLYWRDPKEVMTPEAWDGITVEQYMEKLKRIRKYNTKNLFLSSAVCYIGLNQIVPKEKITHRYWLKVPMREFTEDIRNGIDRKKELRQMFREQLFVNLDGTCGQKIHDYIVHMLESNA